MIFTRGASCRQCGCTDSSPCFYDPSGKRWTLDDLEQLDDEQLEVMELTPCGWVELDPGLCTGCVEHPPPAPLLFGPDGQPLRGAP
ncbi:MAG TPA: hypothetical protein VEB22_11365 [Phycisphaerales bacterium]|nr:hypothetical protein [Phycisphaerales bacterium]